jgi:hypothetical protein
MSKLKFITIVVMQTVSHLSIILSAIDIRFSIIMTLTLSLFFGLYFVQVLHFSGGTGERAVGRIHEAGTEKCAYGNGALAFVINSALGCNL